MKVKVSGTISAILISVSVSVVQSFSWNLHSSSITTTIFGQRRKTTTRIVWLSSPVTADFDEKKSTTTTVLWRQPDKWDLILAELDDEGEEIVKEKDEGQNNSENINKNQADNSPRYLPTPPDMEYKDAIAQRLHQSFLAIRGVGGKEMTNDIYVRNTNPYDNNEKDVFWYVGKVARVSDVTLEECIHRLYPFLERHACHLRPNELYPFRGLSLEVWTAPGDSELEVAYNRPTIQFQRFVHDPTWHFQNNMLSKKNKNIDNDDGHKYPIHIKPSMIGFQGEVYQEGEDGFRTWRNDDGLPARPELNPGGETRPPTAEELQQLQQEIQLESNVSSSSSSSTTKATTNENTSSGIIDAEVTTKSKEEEM